MKKELFLSTSLLLAAWQVDAASPVTITAPNGQQAGVESNGAVDVNISSGNLSVTVGNVSLGNSSATIGVLGNSTNSIGAVTVSSGNITAAVSGNVGITGNVTIGSGNVSAAITSGNVGITGNVTLGNSTNTIGALGNSTAGIGAVTVTSGNITAATTIANGADVTLGNITDSAWSSGNGTVVGILKAIEGGVTGAIPSGTANVGFVGGAQGAAVGSVYGPLVQGVALTAQPSYGNGTINPLNMETDGDLRVALPDYNNSTGTALNVSPSANANQWRGGGTEGNVTAITLAAASATKTGYLTDIECGNTGNTTVTIALSDTGNTTLICPSGGGLVKSFTTPLAGTAGNTTITATPSGNTTSISVFAQGFYQ